MRSEREMVEMCETVGNRRRSDRKGSVTLFRTELESSDETGEPYKPQ